MTPVLLQSAGTQILAYVNKGYRIQPGSEEEEETKLYHSWTSPWFLTGLCLILCNCQVPKRAIHVAFVFI